MLFRTVSLKRIVSCVTIPIRSRSDFSSTCRRSTPSIVIAPAVGS